MGGKAITVTDNDFETTILNADKPALVDFWAVWCGPCKMIAPILEEIAQEYEGQVQVTKLDVDHNNDSAFKYGVMSIPTLILFKDGQPAERIVGYMPKEKLLLRLQPHL